MSDQDDGAAHVHHDAPWKYDGVRVIKGDRLDPNTP
jgi:hypothetical protein